MNLNRNFYEADLWPNLHLYWTNLAKFESFQPFLILLCMKDTSAISGLIYESFSNFSLLGNAKKVPVLTISFHENAKFNIPLFPIPLVYVLWIILNQNNFLKSCRSGWV